MRQRTYSILTFLSLLTPSAQAFVPNPTLTDLPDNTSKSLGPYTCANSDPKDYGCQGITDYGGFVYNPLDHQLLMFGGGHASTMRTDVDVFDIATLQWKPAYPPVPCSVMAGTAGDGKLPAAYDTALDAWHWNGATYPVTQHSGDLIAVSVKTHELVVIRPAGGLNTANTCADPDVSYHPGRIPHYDIDKKTWSFSAIGPGMDYAPDAWAHYPGTEYDPVSGRILVAGDRNGLWAYDPATQSKRKIGASGLGGVMPNIVYYPPTDKFYAFNTIWLPKTTVWEITLDRKEWTNSSVVELTDVTGEAPVCTPADDGAETGFAYDAVNRIIGGAVRGRHFYAFHPDTHAWTSSVIEPLTSQDTLSASVWHAVAYDPVDNVFLIMGYKPNSTANTMFAYRYKRGTVGLAPVGGRDGRGFGLNGIVPTSFFDVEGRKRAPERSPTFPIRGMGLGR